MASLNPVVGELDCPICHAVGRRTVATAHREGRGKRRAIYYHCPECGCIQPRMVGGQEAMQLLVRPIEPDEQDQVVEEVAEAAKEKARTAIREERRKKRTLLDALGDLMKDDDDG